MHPRFQRLIRPAGFSIGLVLPLDNDRSSEGKQQRMAENRPCGVPDLKGQATMVRLAEKAGFSALWVRDVPIYDPDFGDAGQAFEIFSYLGYLAGITENIMLGTAAVVLPLRQPWLTLKAANSVDELSDGRLLLGVASGDRPMEYPLFGVDYEQRAEAFRDTFGLLRTQGKERLPEGSRLFPERDQPAPLLVAGHSQQSPEWIGQHADGWLAYPCTLDEQRRRVALWRKVGGDKPYISTLHRDLLANPGAPVSGRSCGRRALIDELQALREAGVQHVGLDMRFSNRPIIDVVEEIAEYVLPEFR